MSKFAKSFSSSSNPLEVVYPTMRDMIADAASEGYKAKSPKGKSFVHRSTAGNLQFILSNGNDNKFIRISSKLDEALVAGEPVKLEESPVYQTKVIDDAGKEVGRFLTLGLAGIVLEDVKLEEGIAAYLKPEPAGR